MVCGTTILGDRGDFGVGNRNSIECIFLPLAKCNHQWSVSFIFGVHPIEFCIFFSICAIHKHTHAHTYSTSTSTSFNWILYLQITCTYSFSKVNDNNKGFWMFVGIFHCIFARAAQFSFSGIQNETEIGWMAIRHMNVCLYGSWNYIFSCFSYFFVGFRSICWPHFFSINELISCGGKFSTVFISYYYILCDILQMIWIWLHLGSINLCAIFKMLILALLLLFWIWIKLMHLLMVNYTINRFLSFWTRLFVNKLILKATKCENFRLIVKSCLWNDE